MTIAVLTACLGDKTDRLRDPVIVAKGAIYLCATDRPLRATKIWQPIRLPSAVRRDPVLAARQFKILAHAQARGADYYLWIDAAFRLGVDPRECIARAGEADVATFRHPDCPTLDVEAATIVKRGLVPAIKIDRQVAAYRADGMPMTLTHAATGFLLRRHTARVVAFNELWAAQLTRYGHCRDQMGFDYAAWRTGVAVGYFDGDYRKNAYAQWDGTRRNRRVA